MTSLIINIFSILIIGVLFLGMGIQKKADNPSVKWFLGLLSAAWAFHFISILSDVVEKKPQFTQIAYVANLFGFFAVDVLIICFSFYLRSLLGSGKNKKTGFITVAIISSVIRMVVTLVLELNGQVFSIENGCYVEQRWASVPYALSGIIMAELLVAVLLNHVHFSTRQLWVIILYLVFPIPAVILEASTDIYYLTGASVTLSIMMVYVLIQAVTIEDGKLRESVLEELSSTDLLTGLPNRRAYYNKITQINPKENIGVLFCDINNLKYTNDHFGHTAGDELIKKFSQMLRKYFPEDTLFRVSGDEFVVMDYNVSHEKFFAAALSLRQAIQKSDSIASVGYAYGSGCRVEHLVSEAEEEMYKEKRNYHRDLSITAPLENE